MKASPLKEEAFLLSEGFRGKYIANGKEKYYNRFRGDYINTYCDRYGSMHEYWSNASSWLQFSMCHLLG